MLGESGGVEVVGWPGLCFGSNFQQQHVVIVLDIGQRASKSSEKKHYKYPVRL